MEFYNSTPTGNQHADIVPARYINFTLEQLNSISETYKTLDEPYHVMLVNIEILLLLCEKYPKERGYVKRHGQIPIWKETFYIWFDRCKDKIPKKYRNGIQISAEDLFLRLEKL